jgi:hypothetical protein
MNSRQPRARARRSTTPWLAFVARRGVLPACLVVMFAAAPVSAQTSMPGRIGITVEGLNVWQQRNDVRIPAALGGARGLSDDRGRRGR